MKQIEQGFTLIELMIVVAIIGILAALALPQYQTHVVKTQATRIMGEAGALKSSVEDCMNLGKSSVGSAAGECDPHANGSSLIVGDSQIGAALPAGTGVPQVAIDSASGTVKIEATIGLSASAIMDKKTLTWSRDASGTWSCATTIEAKYRPNGCEASS